MTRYIKRINGERQTIERTLDERDAAVIAGGFVIEHADGTRREQGIEELNAAGTTRIVASYDFRFHRWNIDEQDVPASLFSAPNGTTVEVP